MYGKESNLDGDPLTINKALARTDGDLWQKAVDYELMSLKDNLTLYSVQMGFQNQER